LQILSNQSKYKWKFYGREKQLPPPGDWKIWVILAGRGFGKSLAATQWARFKVESSDKPTHGAFVGRTPADVRDILIEGESGILNISPPWNKPIYKHYKRQLIWPNGSIAHTYSFENPDQLRGPQHEWAIVDELASASDEKSWDNLMFGMRSGKNPQIMVTTTPRPIKIIKDLVDDPSVIIVRGSTYDNRANLPESFIKAIEKKYLNTRIGRQEIFAEILDDVEGALWNFEMIEKNRVKIAPELKRIVVAIDPAGTSKQSSDETGIIVAGLGIDDHGYVLADQSMRASPSQWASEAIRLYEHWKADMIIAESNYGGDMVALTLKTASKDKIIPFKLVTASRGKDIRAQPIVSLDEQGRIHHVGIFEKLEDQMCSWIPNEPHSKSPDRVDARVWALTELMLNQLAVPQLTRLG